MHNLDDALADISNIRNQLAAGSMFHGFGPKIVATTGLLAFFTMVAQIVYPELLAADSILTLDVWVITAVLCGTLIAGGAILRAQRYHGDLYARMLIIALSRFLPAIAAGAAIALIISELKPAMVWMLPGLWQILVSLGVFSALSSLPRAVAIVGIWYFLTVR